MQCYCMSFPILTHNIYYPHESFRTQTVNQQLQYSLSLLFFSHSFNFSLCQSCPASLLGVHGNHYLAPKWASERERRGERRRRRHILLTRLIKLERVSTGINGNSDGTNGSNGLHESLLASSGNYNIPGTSRHHLAFIKFTPSILQADSVCLENKTNKDTKRSFQPKGLFLQKARAYEER